VPLLCIFINLFHISIHRSWVLILFYIQSVMICCFGWNGEKSSLTQLQVLWKGFRGSRGSSEDILRTTP
jgi:hypothetical protein